MRPAKTGRRAWLVGCALMTIAALDGCGDGADCGADGCRRPPESRRIPRAGHHPQTATKADAHGIVHSE